MTVAYAAGIRTARLNAVADACDAGAGAALLRIYDGVRPASGGAATNLLAELTMGDPSFAAPSLPTMTANAISDETSAPASGTATWFRIVDSTSAFCIDGDVRASGDADSGEELVLDDKEIVAGGVVSITSLVITTGNA